ncbi:MAG: hypothetical protein JWN76_492 [Chitinophagaceae bacterium]|nr:hypothetical protein [Chitinophagaceae bacterium]
MFFTLRNFSNPVQVTIQTLKHLRVKITATTVNRTLEQHPDYPSLLSINDTLKQFKIETTPLKVDKDYLQDLPLPFIAHTTDNNEHFVTVHNITEDKVYYQNRKSDRKGIESSYDNFKKMWTGNTLLVNAGSSTGEENFFRLRIIEWFTINTIPLLLGLFFLITLLSVFLTIVNQSSVLPYIALLFFSIAGISVSILLLWFEVDKTNSALKKICAAGANANCGAVLNSKHSKFLGWLTWSEIGFYYFFGNYLFLFLSGLKALPFVALLNLFVFPYTFFSIYYQWRIAKQWCLLCLTIQGILVTQVAISFFFKLIPTILPISFNDVPGSFGISYFLPIAFWNMLKPLLLKIKESTPKIKELNRLKGNQMVFDSLLKKQKEIPRIADNIGITFGSSSPIFTIIKVCNPYCGPCSKAHPILEDILHSNPNVKLHLLFNARNLEGDKKQYPVKHFFAIQNQYGMELLGQALDDWYNNPIKDYGKFAKKYPVNKELHYYNKQVEDMYQWCSDAEIKFTPTFFINGHQLPSIYSISDLKQLLS